MNYTSSVNPNVVKTALDDVFMQKFDGSRHPGYIDATSDLAFKQDSVSNAAVIEEVFKGTGLWGARAEEANVDQATPEITNQVTFSVTNYAQSVDISKNFFDDNMHGAYEKMVGDMGETGRITRDTKAFAIYRGAFDTTTVASGDYLVSDSHTLISGDTVDNKSTAVLSPSSLEAGVVALVEQKAQDGTIRGSLATRLIVPSALYKEAVEITESELEAQTADNQLNVFSAKYGLRVGTTPYLGAAAGGSDTAWFLSGDNHSVTRWVRQAVSTDLIPYQYQRNNNYIYKGEFREVCGAVDYAGFYGSNGTA